jgi:hypothetical protein
VNGQAGTGNNGGCGEKDRQYRKFSQRIRFPGVDS